ncbi:hypothetical protein B9G55_07185 [Saccharibacillus sp. O16]|nr:hypothetical protein B9G55_07185 [Saccharibacillus sp. O16]
MKSINRMRKTLLAVSAAGVVAVGSLGAAAQLPVPTASAAQSPAPTASDQKMALQHLNEFYKPALNGMFPGNASSFVVGKTTRAEVIKRFGAPSVSRTSATGFDSYTADMGNPGYSMSYDASGVLKEIRYFGTNVERQTNIGGMTASMLWMNWFKPTSSNTIKVGNTKQLKLVYKRGAYNLEFIFNTPTELSHINLVKG